MVLRVKTIFGEDLGIYHVKNSEEEYDLVYNYLGQDYDSICLKSVPEFALFTGRHSTLENMSSIFGHSIDNPRDLLGLERRAEQYVCFRDEVCVYVTGLTVATVAVINACHKLGVHLTLMHWDKDSQTYYPQEVY